MGQLTSITRRLPAEDTVFGDRGEQDLRWLCLLDQLYALVESDGFWPSQPDQQQDWPANWQPLIHSWGVRIGARAIHVVEPLRVPAPLRHATHLSRRRSLSAQPPAQGPVILAQSLSVGGFTADQEREFHAFCSHLYTALALLAELSAARQGLASLYGVIDAMPTSIVMLDEGLNVALLNRQAREWLARTERLVVRARRVFLSSETLHPEA